MAGNHADSMPSEFIGETAPAPLQMERRKVLLVQADRIDQRVLQRLLDLLGHDVETAGQGRDALVRWRRGDIDLIMADARLPDMDAPALARTVRLVESARRLVRTPIVMVGSVASGAAGATPPELDGTLGKPVHTKALQDVLARCLTQRPTAAPVAPVSRPTRPVDLDVLHRLVGDDPSVVREFLVDYLAAAREQAKELRRAYQQGDVRLVGALAHKLRSASLAVGALALGDLCAEMELPAQSDFGTAELEHARFDRVFDAAMAQIESHLRKMTP